MSGETDVKFDALVQELLPGAEITTSGEIVKELKAHTAVITSWLKNRQTDRHTVEGDLYLVKRMREAAATIEARDAEIARLNEIVEHSKNYFIAFGEQIRLESTLSTVKNDEVARTIKLLDEVRTAKNAAYEKYFELMNTSEEA